MRAKLGLANEEVDDITLIEDLFRLMQNHRADYTNTFRALTLGQPEATAMGNSAAWLEWQNRWSARLERQPQGKDAARQLMRQANPAVIPRNHRVEEALTAAVEQGDLSVMERLLAVLADPYAYSSEQEDYAALPAASDQPYVTFCGT